MSKTNPSEETVDFLDEDDEIRGQNYVLLSFLSPEKVLQNKERHFFNEFLKDYEIGWKTKNLEKYLAEQIISIRKTLLDEADKLETQDLSGAALKCRDAANQFRVEEVLDTYQAFLTKNKKEINTTTINSSYDEFIYKNQERLEDEFYAKNNFHTSMRGLKVRGVYSNQVEAQGRAKKLQQKDKRHDILIGEVGKWLAWDPAPHQIPNQEYANDELNKLMKKYNENEEARDKFYQENPSAKNAKNVKSVFNMSLQPSDMAGATGENATVSDGTATATTAATVTEATSTLFEGTADLALARKMKQSASVNEMGTTIDSA